MPHQIACYRFALHWEKLVLKMKFLELRGEFTVA